MLRSTSNVSIGAEEPMSLQKLAGPILAPHFYKLKYRGGGEIKSNNLSATIT